MENAGFCLRARQKAFRGSLRMMGTGQERRYPGMEIADEWAVFIGTGVLVIQGPGGVIRGRGTGRRLTGIVSGTLTGWKGEMEYEV